jgi:hypothetical protein
MALFIIPGLMILALVSIPYLRYPYSTEGIWFSSLRGRRSARDAAVVALFATPVGILLDEYLIDLNAWTPGLSPALSNGLIPVFILLAISYGTYRVLKRRHATNKNESVQMIFVFFLTAFIVLTVIGIGFRGSAMRLVWPWM